MSKKTQKWAVPLIAVVLGMLLGAILSWFLQRWTSGSSFNRLGNVSVVRTFFP